MCKKEDFEKLYTLDVSKQVEKKEGLSYLSWAYAWREFKRVYPDAEYTVKKDENGRCYFGDEDIGYMVYTTVTAGNLTYEMWLPVMDSKNKTMKLKPYKYITKYGEKTVAGISMFDINKTVMRCLVKNLAMFGLGLYIYAGEDLPEEEKNASEEFQKPGFRIPPESDPPVRCDACGLRLQDYFDGKTLIKAADLADRSNRLNGRVLCPKCTKKERSNAG